MDGLRGHDAPTDLFTETLTRAVLGAPSGRRPDMNPETAAAALQGHLQHHARSLWALAWREGAAWGISRTPVRIELAGLPAGTTVNFKAFS